MAIGLYFNNEGFTLDKYNEAIKKLEAAGAAAPKGRMYHVAFGPKEQVQVFDIWEDQATFEKFGETLLPILGALGVTIADPMSEPVHNIIVGK